MANPRMQGSLNSSYPYAPLCQKGEEIGKPDSVPFPNKEG